MVARVLPVTDETKNASRVLSPTQTIEVSAQELETVSEAELVKAPPSPRRLRPATDRPARSSSQANSTLMGIPAQAAPAISQPYAHLNVGTKPKTVDLADRKAAARELVEWCEKQLASEKDPAKKARLHFEQARLYETTLDDAKLAHKHYQLAHAAHPANWGSLLGLVRVRIRLEQWEGALGPLREIIALCEAPEDKAAFFALRAALLEGYLAKPKEARAEYERAIALTPNDPSLIYQIYRSAERDQDWQAVGDALGQWARVAEKDVEWSAALIAEQARVAEHLRKKSAEALPLYERAFQLAPRATSAPLALERLYAQRSMTDELGRLFQARAGLMNDAEVRAAELVSAGALKVHSGGDLLVAAQLFEAAFQAHPEDRTILGRLYQVYTDLQDHEGALTTLIRLELSAREPDEIAELNQAMGQLLALHIARPKDAIVRFEKALSLTRVAQDSVDALVVAYEASGEFERMVRVLSHAEKNSDDAEYRVQTHLKLARTYERALQKPELAISHYQAVLGIEQMNQEAFRNLVRLLEERERFEEVIELHERAAKSAENEQVYFAELFLIGDLLEHRMNEPLRAMAVYQRVLAKKPDHLGAHFRLQRAAQAAGQYEVLVDAYAAEAKVQTSKAQRLSLLHSAAQVCEESLADHDRALLFYQQVLAVEPLRKETLFALAQFHERHGRRAEQLEVLEKLLSVVAEAHAQSALLARMGRIAERYLADFDAALGYFKRALVLVPTDRAGAQAVTRLLHRSGKKEDLAQHLEEQLKLSPRSPERALGYARLGELYEWGLGKLPQALVAYQTALSDEPTLAVATAGIIRVLEQRPDHDKTEAALVERAAHSKDATLSTWSRLRAAELAESRATKAVAARELHAEIRKGAARQPQSTLAQMRLASEQGRAAALRLSLTGIGEPSSQQAVLRELLRLSFSAASEEQVSGLVQEILTLDRRDRLALFAAELSALKSGDEQALAQADRWMVSALEDADKPSQRVTQALYKTRLGEFLQSKNAILALQMLSEAVRADGANLGGARALTRIAEVVDDVDLLVESAEREITIVRDTGRAAQLLVRAADLLIKNKKDEPAINHLKEALRVHPSSVEAARKLHDVLSAHGQYVDLTATLRQAAEQCSDAKLAVEHWISVARIAADKRDDVSEAIFVLEQLEKTKRGNLHSSLALGEFLLRDRQWDKAVAQLQKSLQLQAEPQVAISLRLQLAEVYHSHLARPGDATRELREVLKTEPNHQGALRRLLVIQMKEGSGLATETAEKLVAISSGKERAEAQLSLGRLQLGLRKVNEAVTQLCAAVEVIGLQPPDAAEELRKILTSPAGAGVSAEGYEKALDTFARATTPGEHQARVYRELGRVIAQRDVPRAIAKLQDGLRHNPGDFALRRLYADLLKEQRKFEQARTELLTLVSQQPLDQTCWEDLMIVQDALLLTQEAELARGALTIIGGGTEQQKATWRTRLPRFGQVPALALHQQLLSEALPEPVPSEALALLEQLGPLAGKVFVPELADFNVSPRSKVGPRGSHPLRPVVDRVCQCLGGLEVDLYVSDSAPRATVMLTDPLGLVLPASLQNLSEAEQVFVVTRCLANAARRSEVVDALDLDTLRLLFAASSRLIDPAAQPADVNDKELSEVTRRLSKALPWLSRGRIEDAARRFAATSTDVARLKRTLTEGSYRVALVFCDDLGMVERMLKGPVEHLGLSEHQAQHLAKHLLAYWLSPAAMSLRRAIGLSQ